MNLVPLGDRLVVKPIEQEQTTASGIVLPESAKEKPQRGKVVAAGPGRLEDGERQPMDVAIDDIVVFDKWSGKEFKIDDIKYLILNEGDVLAKLAE